MKDLLILLVLLLITVAKLLGPGGARAVATDSLLMKQQLLVINRSQRRAPNLSALNRIRFSFWSLFLDPRRIQRAAVIIRPSMLLKFHDLIKKRISTDYYIHPTEKGSQVPRVHHRNLSTRPLN
jgi:putative transposase